MPLNDNDLDLMNFCKAMPDGESVIYIRSDGKDIVNLVFGDVGDLCEALFQTKDIRDVVLTTAVMIMREEEIDPKELFDEVNKYIEEA